MIIALSYNLPVFAHDRVPQSQNGQTKTVFAHKSFFAQDPVTALDFGITNPDTTLSFLDTNSVQPVLRVLYTANTRGALFPCPT